MTTLVTTITETLRYRGRLGQWSWVLHRLGGLGTVLFLILHIIDTSWATFFPELYAKAIEVYQTPLFTLLEFALVACVVYHAYNGYRIVIFDWRPQWWRRQADAAKIVLGATVLTLIPIYVIMFRHVLAHYQDPTVRFDLQLDKVIESVLPFAGGVIVILAAGVILSLAASVVPGLGTGKRAAKLSRYDSFMWTFMRVSGLLILPLAFGHLAMIHVINGVFDISQTGYTPALTNYLGNVIPNLAQGQQAAANYVALRWNTLFAGVFIWRIYDAALLALAVVHGANGLRYVVKDYIHNRTIGRGIMFAIFWTAVGYIVVGALALINTVPAVTAKLAQ